MEVGILSMRYAKAIIEYAQEKGLEDRLYQEFLTLSHSFCEQPGLREALDNPVITTKEKLALVCTAADGDCKHTVSGAVLENVSLAYSYCVQTAGYQVGPRIEVVL